MVRRSAATALASRCFVTIVVLGHQAAEVREALDGPAASSRLRQVQVDDPSAGIAASLAAGLRAARDLQAEAAAVCLGDMPLLRASTLDRLVDTLEQAPAAWGCVPSLAGVRGNPVLWRARAFDTLAGLRGDRGGAQLIEGLGEAMLRLELDDGGILEDFDTPERLAHFADLGRGGGSP